jgi:hypothetical protein
VLLGAALLGSCGVELLGLLEAVVDRSGVHQRQAGRGGVRRARQAAVRCGRVGARVPRPVELPAANFGNVLGAGGAKSIDVNVARGTIK